MEKLRKWLNTQKGEKFARIAAICKACLATWSFISLLFGEYGLISYIETYGIANALVSYLFIINNMLAVVMAIALFKRNKKVVIAVEGVEALASITTLVYNISYVVYWLKEGASGMLLLYIISTITTILSLVLWIAIIVITAMSLKGNSAVKRIWFIPAAVDLLQSIIILFDHWSFRYMLLDIVYACMYLLIGLWLRNDITPKRIKPTDAFGSADKLKMYKELLDSGAITQEEFDSKKNQILGL